MEIYRAIHIISGAFDHFHAYIRYKRVIPFLSAALPPDRLDKALLKAVQQTYPHSEWQVHEAVRDNYGIRRMIRSHDFNGTGKAITVHLSEAPTLLERMKRSFHLKFTISVAEEPDHASHATVPRDLSAVVQWVGLAKLVATLKPV